MYCYQCGKDIPDDSTFCPFCRADQASLPEPEKGLEERGDAGGEGPAPGGEPQPMPSETQEPLPVKGKIKPALTWILAIAVVIALIAMMASPSLMKNLTGFQMPFSSSSVIPTVATPESTPPPTGPPLTATTPTRAPTTTRPTTQATLLPTTYVAAYPPSVDFTASPTSGQAPFDVKFTDSSENSPTSWQWSFGDGGSSTERNPIHRYYSAGSYTVTLVAQNSIGIDQSTRTGYITVTVPVTTAPPTTPPDLVPDWDYVPTSGPAPLAVHFFDHSAGSPTSWKWTFGDGTSSTEQNTVHTYTTPGSYTIGFDVGNQWQALGNGNIGTVVVTAPVTTAPPVSPPTAHMFYEPFTGPAPLEVHFSDLSTGTIKAWLWTFGDGGSSGQQHPVHTYTAPGSYYVTLVVTNDGGTSNEYTGPIVVTVAGPPGCSWTGSWYTDDGMVELQQSGTSVTGTYSWNMGEITGTVSGNKLTGTWSEAPTFSPPNDAGDFEFTMAGDCISYTSRWRYDSSGAWSYGDWDGMQY